MKWSWLNSDLTSCTHSLVSVKRTLFYTPKQNCMQNLKRFCQSSLWPKIPNTLFPPGLSITIEIISFQYTWIGSPKRNDLLTVMPLCESEWNLILTSLYKIREQVSLHDELGFGGSPSKCWPSYRYVWHLSSCNKSCNLQVSPYTVYMP